MVILEDTLYLAVLWYILKAIALLIYWIDPQSPHNRHEMSAPNPPATPKSIDDAGHVPKSPSSIKKKVPATPAAPETPDQATKHVKKKVPKTPQTPQTDDVKSNVDSAVKDSSSHVRQKAPKQVSDQVPEAPTTNRAQGTNPSQTPCHRLI